MTTGTDPLLAEHLASLCGEGRASRALFELRVLSPGDDGIGFRRIVESRVVRDLLAIGAASFQARSTEKFRKDFASFDLSRGEGYLMSLLDRPLRVERLMMVSSLGRFDTLLAISHLREVGAIELEDIGDETMTTRRDRR